MPKKATEAAPPPPPQYEQPVIQPSSRDPREVLCIVKLAAPVCKLFEFQITVSPRTKIHFIIDKIVERHGGSIKDLSVCVNRFHPEEIVSPAASLEECGVTGGECSIYYDFAPTVGPLLQ